MSMRFLCGGRSLMGTQAGEEGTVPASYGMWGYRLRLSLVYLVPVVDAAVLSYITFHGGFKEAFRDFEFSKPGEGSP